MSDINCKACNDSQEVKPIKLFWKDDIYCMEDKDMGDLMVSEHLGLDIPEGITNFQVCIDCSEVLTDHPDDIDKYSVLINDILRDIVMTNAEAVIANAEADMEESLK
jgi:hypothetical protein